MEPASTLLTLAAAACLLIVNAALVEAAAYSPDSEVVALVTAGPILILSSALRSPVRLLGSAARALVRMLGAACGSVHSLARTPDEIRTLVERSHEEGMVEDDEREMIRGVFDCRALIARDVMTPRRDIVAVPVTAGLSDVVERVIQDGHSRLPVYNAGLDDIIGVLLAKDLIGYLAAGGARAFDLRDVLREPYFVPDTKRVDELIAELRANAIHLALVLDEFGGTEGLVTLEDLLEEIVGDIYDEHDVPASEEFVVRREGEVIMDGRVPIAEVNVRYDLKLPMGDYTTIGGYVFGALGRIPAAGDVVSLNGCGELVVEETCERRVTRVRLVQTTRAAT